MSGVNFGHISETMGRSTGRLESNMQSFMKNYDETSTRDMIKLQQMSSQWSMAVNLQSTTMKLVADTLKGIVQKVG